MNNFLARVFEIAVETFVVAWGVEIAVEAFVVAWWFPNDVQAFLLASDVQEFVFSPLLIYVR